MTQEPNAIDAAMGAKVVARRTELGLSAESLAAGLGISVETLARYESGSARLGAVLLLRLTQILKVDLRYFLGGGSSGGGAAAPQSSGAANGRPSSRDG